MIDRPYNIIVGCLFAAYLIVHCRAAAAILLKAPAPFRRALKLCSLALLGIIAAGTSIHIHSIASHFPAPYYVRANLRAIATLWMAGAVGAWCADRIIAFTFRRLKKQEVIDPTRRQLLTAVRSAAMAAPVAVIAYGALGERTRVQREYISVPVPNLHPDLERVRMVQISDIHLSPTLAEAEFARMIDMVNELRPDLIFVTGDLITKPADPLDRCLYQLKRLKPGVAVIGSMGNHEVYARSEDYLTRVGPHYGIEFLRYAGRQFRFGNATLNVAGVDYEPLANRGNYLTNCEQLVRPGSANILLSHNPDVLPVAARKGFQLTLAGHMHGGQVSFEVLHPMGNIARFYSPYVSGLYDLSDGQDAAWGYVNRGLGTIGVPIRIGASPEITVIQLSASQSGSARNPDS